MCTEAEVFLPNEQENNGIRKYKNNIKNHQLITTQLISDIHF